MKHFIPVLITSLLLMTASATASAFRMKHLVTGNGLSNNRINAILKDNDGFIWIGSTSGLCRYDGYDIKFFSEHDNALTPGNTVINEIQQSPDGRLWIRSGNGYIVYNPVDEKFTTDIAETMTAAGISGTPSLIHFDSSGTMWVYVEDCGLFSLPFGNSKATFVLDMPDPAPDITDITERNDTIVCVDRSGAITFIDPGTMTATDKMTAIPDNDINDYTFNYTADVDRDGNIWLFNTERLWLYDPDSDRWLTDRLPDAGHNMMVKTLYQGRDGEIWIGRDHHGLERVVKTPEGITFEAVDDKADDNRANSYVTAIYEDESGTMWIGTYKKGLFYHNESAEKFSIEPFPDVNCIIADPAGKGMWVGTDNSGLIWWDPHKGESRYIPDPAEGATPAAITSMAYTPDGTLYIGSFSRGLKKLKDGVFSRIDTGTALDSSYSWAITTGSGGELWIGTLGGGLYNYNPDTGKTEAFNVANSGLPSDYIISAIHAGDGKLYLATSAGIAVCDPVTERITPLIFPATGNNDQINTGNINQIYEDSRGLLWIATPNGLKVYDRVRNRLHDIPLRDNLSYLYILGIIEDSNTGMWVSEGGNLINIEVNFDDKNGELATSVHVYDSRDGLQTSDFNQRSLAMLDNGDIVAGGLYGINRFSPASIKYNKTLPRVMFTRLAISGHEVAVGEKIDGHIILSQALNHGHTIELPDKCDNFTIHFATDNYVLPDKTTYYYKLEGYNDNWITCPPRVNHVTYTNLSPGKYRLLVKAINSDGYESIEPAELTIRILPPFYATPLAWVIYLLAAAGLIYGIIKFVRTRELRRFNERRHEDAMRKQDELNQFKFKFFTNISHELRTPLTLIVSPLEAMLREPGNDEKQTRRLTMMRNNAMRLLHLVNQLLDFRKNEVVGLQLNPSEGDIIAFVRNTCNSFTTMSERKNINLTFYSPCRSIDMMFDADKMGKIIINLLSNAFKFTPAGGRVDVAVERLDGNPATIRIKVADTGIGIKDKDKQHIFERFYQADDKEDSNPGTGSGIGLSLVSEYVKLHDGTISVTDNPGAGSVFIIDIPIKGEFSETKPEDGKIDISDNTAGSQIISTIDEVSDTAADKGPKTDNTAAVVTDPATTPRPENNRMKRPTALVVDDSPDMLEFIKDGLTPEFHVITASDGAEALKLLQSLKPSIILTDLMTPQVDGIDLCRRLKANADTASIPIIILTAKHDMQAKVEGLTIGADDYITKPFNIDVLIMRMRRLVELTGKGASRSTIDTDPGEIKITPLDERLIEKAVKYVVSNIKRPDLSVEEMSAHLGMSRVHLYKKMKAITGKTPIEFIRLIRLKRAAQMLRESQLNISEIAYQLGFNNPKYFSKYFKDEFGILPSAYQSIEGKETNQTV